MVHCYGNRPAYFRPLARGAIVRLLALWSSPVALRSFMTRGRIAVIVVNHDTREHLRRCLRSVLADRPAQTVVVDTASRDGSNELVREEFPSVELLETANRGYGAAANAGLERIRAPYAFLLNADTRPAAGALPALESYLDRRPRTAVLGPLIVNERGRPEITARRFPTPAQILLQESGLHRLWPPKRENRRAQEVDWVLGSALALRREAVAEVGGFDEAYFMYNEEVDLCLRLHATGWEIWYAPVTTVAHSGGASTSQQRQRMAQEYVRSTTALYRRHFSPTQQAQLRVIFEAALVARLVRDRARLLLTRDSTRRKTLGVELEAWRTARQALRTG
jgi:N-acetylglucosaminyl-diphospho-decaprenol L-rhamnosyltransferase